MRLREIGALAAISAATLSLYFVNWQEPTTHGKIKSDSALPHAPNSFIMNVGQFHEDVLFQTRTANATVWFTESSVVHQFIKLSEEEPISDEIIAPISRKAETRSLSFEFPGSNSTVEVRGRYEMGHKTNYLKGNDNSKWQRAVPSFQEIIYEDLFDGIDLRYYYKAGNLEYDLIVAPGHSLSQVRTLVNGADDLDITTDGELVIAYEWGEIVERIPSVYQQDGDEIQPLDGSFELYSENEVGFNINGSVNNELAIVFDPEIQYSSFIGGSGKDVPHGVKADADGNLYVIGATHSTDFDGATGSGDVDGDIFIAKIDTDECGASSLVFSTYIGGTADEGFELDLDIDNTGNIYFTGSSKSTDFPIADSTTAYQPALDEVANTVIGILNSSGTSLIYSTYFGSGVTYGTEIGLDDNDTIYVAGWLYNIPPLLVGAIEIKNGFDSIVDGGNTGAYICKIDYNASGSNQLLYSTYIDGNKKDEVRGMYVSGAGECYVVGETESDEFLLENEYDGTFSGSSDGFVTKIDTRESGTLSLVYSTLLGGNGKELPWQVTVDNDGFAFITGLTTSTDLDVSDNAYDKTGSGYSDADAFIFVLDSSGSSMTYCTYLGNGAEARDEGRCIAVTSDGLIWAAGPTLSDGFEVKEGFETSNDSFDLFLVKLNPDTSLADTQQLLFSTYIGGSGSDHGPHDLTVVDDTLIYLVSPVQSTDFVMTLSAYEDEHNDTTKPDVVVMRLVEGTYSGCERGDVNKSGHINDVDYDELYDYIWNSGPAPACLAACDVNNSGGVDYLDAVDLYKYLTCNGSLSDSTCTCTQQ